MPRALSFGMRRATPRTVFAFGTPHRVSARCAEIPWLASCCRMALRRLRHHGRSVRRIDFCLLTSSYEYPRLVGSRQCRSACAPRATGNRLIHVRAARFGGPHQLDASSWRSFSSPVATRGGRTSGIPVAPSTRVRPLARCTRLESRQDRHRLVRVNDASLVPIRDTFHRARNPCPATPSRAPGSGLPRVRGFAAATPILAALFAPRESLRIPGELGPRPRAPFATGRRASLDLSVACRLLQP
jgi:hypothetical protein